MHTKYGTAARTEKQAHINDLTTESSHCCSSCSITVHTLLTILTEHISLWIMHKV